jgi:hypothetical protein
MYYRIDVPGRMHLEECTWKNVPGKDVPGKYAPEKDVP